MEPYLANVGSMTKELSPEEQSRAEDYEAMFSAGDSNAFNTSMMDFDSVAHGVGLTRDQIDGLKAFDGNASPDMSMSEYHAAFGKAARGLGMTNDQIRKLIEYDRMNNWE